MSNKYFCDWQSSNSSNSSKSETSHLGILKRLDDDNARLDRALDKIKTDEKAAKIFNQSQQRPSSKSNQYQIHTHVSFVNLGSPCPQPVHLTYVSEKFVVVNGCVVMPQNDFF